MLVDCAEVAQEARAYRQGEGEMNVRELREYLADMPDYWPVYVAVNSDHFDGSGADTDYLHTLDCESGNFPSQGNMAVIRLAYTWPKEGSK